jgi:hypothetical protein
MGEVPESMKSKQVFALDLSAIIGASDLFHLHIPIDY